MGVTVGNMIEPFVNKEFHMILERDWLSPARFEH